jgi:uncharacterized protein YhjY with autotransporter beta-barrel domain
MANSKEGLRANLLIGLASGALLSLGVTPQAHAITTQDNINPNSLLDTTNQYNNVGGVIVLNPDIPAGFADFCTGTLINPRTVLTATHCVRNSAGPEIYTSGGPYTVRFRLSPNGAAPSIFATDVILPPGANAASFPNLDFTIVALGRAVPDIQGAPVLLSPLTRDTLATMVGYGTFGTGSNPNGGFDFRRRVAQNVIQYLGSFENFDENTFGPGNYGDSTQFLYFTDFDRVGRTKFFDDPAGIDYDPLPGAALNDPSNPQHTEGSTGPGDSGGPLFASVNGQNYLAGVLSGGLTIFTDSSGHGLFGYYGTESYWNPIFEYASFLVANDPYKYVHAIRGDGDWTDPAHWEQTLDPGFFVLDNHGNPVNGIPTKAPNDSSIQWGQFRNIFDVFAFCIANPSQCVGFGLTSTAETTTDVAQVGASTFSDPQNNGAAGSTPPLSGGPRPSPLQGPGSRNFVPNNTNGSPGVEFANPAQYFDVTFDNPGTTTLRNAAIEIDHLTTSDSHAELDIAPTGALLVNLETEIQYGQINVDGTLATRSLFNTYGVLSGRGVITALFGVTNLGGVVSPGDFGIGTLTVNGNFTQSHFGTMFYQIGKDGSHDLLSVTGNAAIAGDLIVQSAGKLHFGDSFEVVHAAGGVTGNFDQVLGGQSLLFGRTVTDADSIDLLIDAHAITDYLSVNSPMWSLAHAIDMARFGGHYADLTGVFDRIDYIDVNKLTFVLPVFAPINAFQQLSLASNFSDSLSQSLTVRMSELRAGVRGMSQSSIIAGERMLQPASENVFGAGPSTPLQSGPDAPQQGESRFGAFVSGFGNFSELGGEAYEGDRFNLASLTTASSANMTMGVDYRVDDHFVIGVASTVSRYLAHDDGVIPLNYAGYGATFYAGWWEGNWSLDSYVGVAHQDYEINRVLSPGLVGTSAGAKPGASQMLAGVRAGWSLHPFNGFEIGPRVSLDYQRLSLDKYAEAGGGDLDLQVDGREVTSLQVQTSLEFAYQPVDRDGNAGPFAAFGNVALVNELGDGADVVRARFAAAPEFPFVITNGLDRSWTTASLGVVYRPNASLSLNLQASSDFGRNDALSSTSLQTGFSYTF